MDVQKVATEYRFNYWSEIIKECRSSGQTVSCWYEEHSINNKSYYYWLMKIRIVACNSIPAVSNKQQSIVLLKTSGDVQPVFTEIKVPSNEPIQSSIIFRINSTVFEIYNGVANITIENTLKALKNIF